MSFLILPLPEARLLRRQIRRLQKYRLALVEQNVPEAIHDLRVASRRLREVLDYLKPAVPEESYVKLSRLTKRITRMLGSVREVQVNLQLLEGWLADQKGDPCALEYLIHHQKMLMEQNRVAVIKKLRRNKFGRYDKFLTRLKGSTKMPNTSSTLLETRKSDFLTFQWPTRVSNVQLHNLRIRTKKLRYAVEIADTLTSKKLTPTVKKLKKLQDVLGAVHDLSMVMALARGEQQEWRALGFQVIPSALGKVYRVARAERSELLPKIQERYDQVYGRKSIPAMPLQAAEAAAVTGASGLKQAG